VFFVGLLLDLLGSYFVIWELGRFKNYLKANEEWLTTVVNKHKLFVRDDFDRILTEFGEMFTRRSWAISLKVFIFWKIDNLKQWFSEMHRGYLRIRLLRPYNRLQSFMVSLVFASPSDVKTDFLLDQLRLWRTSRAISTSLLILAFEIPLFLGESLVWIPIYLLPFSLSGFITLRAYSRFCQTLLSLVYVTQSRAINIAKA
jgi:hypothetical protein